MGVCGISIIRKGGRKENCNVLAFGGMLNKFLEILSWNRERMVEILTNDSGMLLKIQ